VTPRPTAAEAIRPGSPGRRPLRQVTAEPVADDQAPAAADRRSRWWIELLVIGWLAWVYDIITNLAAVREQAAFRHGLDVLHLEQALHIDPELAFNSWLHRHLLLGLLAGDYYGNAHFVVTFAVIGWLWWRHPRAYRPLRNGLVLINVIGFAVYWVYPMAPLRLLPGVRAYDIVALTHAFGGWQASGTIAHAANEFAAMPSLHLAWAVWCAYAVWYVFRHRRAALLAWVYPVMTCLDVLATGNHLVLDCLAGVATMAVATVAGFALSRQMECRTARRRLAPSPPARREPVS
jgi:hypothetical protein